MEKLTLYRKPFSGDPAKDRHKFIGGSDAGTIMNVNPWKSQYELWLEKTGQLEPDDISNKLQVWFGTEEEEIVAKRFCLETGKSVRRSNMTYLCKEYPFLAGHVDRMVVGENAGLECKTTSAWNKTAYQDGEIPPQYYWQCMHYMMLTGCEKWYIAVKKDNTQFHILQIDRNDDYIDALLSAEQAFWDLVVNNTVPEIDGSESTSNALQKRYSDDTRDVIDLSYSSTVTQCLQSIQDVDVQIDALNKIKAEYQNKIKAEIGEHEGGFTAAYRVSWKTQNRSSIDAKRLEAEHPDIYQNYLKTTQSRVFKITKIKEKTL